MKTVILFILAAALPATAQSLPLWQDPEATSRGADTRRNELIWFTDRRDALSKGFRQSENYLSLNGTWDFLYFDSHREAETAAAAILRDRNADVQWKTVSVPGNWEVQGYGTPLYTNIPYDFAPSSPQPPQLPEAVPTGLYHRTFSVPDAWKGRAVYLNLCGIKSGTYVYVNGQEAGYCEDSKNLARFNLTPWLREGENDLVLKVFRYSTGSYLECQDFWRISGIERDVYLSSEAADTGFAFNVVSTLDPSMENGIFQLRMRSRERTEVFYELLDRDGNTLADAVYTVRGSLTTVADTLPGVRHWSAETPELYTLLLRVNGEYTRFHVGFRRLEIASVPDGDRSVKAFLVNGRPVRFKGVNYHEHNPYTGHYLTRENILEDLLLMKKANINAIRTSHYPQPREFYELCDSLGFYVYDEANIESHGMGYSPDRTLGNHPLWQAKHIDRILNMYHRTADYPCVTFLSLGNEAGNGVNFQEGYRVLKALEQNGQNRPVVYERAERSWNTDIIVPQYPGAEWFRRMGEQESLRPVIPSEYAHAMGNSTGSLDLQWEEIRKHPHLQGGFIWDWADQGLYDPRRIWTYGGDYGKDAPSDGNFLCNGIVNPDRTPHPGFFEVRHVYQDISVTHSGGNEFQIENRYWFKPLLKHVVRWRVERDGKRIKRGSLRVDVPARGTTAFRLRLPKMKRPGEYRIFFETDSSADEILLADSRIRKVRPARGRKVSVEETEKTITLSSRRAVVLFDRDSGFVRSYTVRGKEMFDPTFGLRPNFWRGPTDNDYGNGLPERLHAWKEASRYCPATVSVTEDEEGACLEADYSLPGGTLLKTQYRLRPDGILVIRAAFTGAEPSRRSPATDIPRIGFRYRVTEDSFRYFGRGPVENYVDRHAGTFKSIYESKASLEFFPYVRPQETGHHTETEWFQGAKMTVVADSLFEFNALRHTVEDLDGEEAVSRDYQWNNFTPGEEHDPGLARNRLRRQTHLDDVPERPFTEICIDLGMSGVGGYDSWGSMPEPSRTLFTSGRYSFGFAMIPARILRPSRAVRYAY
ncbi:MAG: beta-galactosidase [Bacteroidales bacterium]|nr:beta-galactosidase [Bacteroidales bacterium]